MEAPRDKVIEKLLHAHQSRAQRVILDFVRTPGGTSTTIVSSPSPARTATATTTAAASSLSPVARANAASSTASPSSPSGEKRPTPSTDDLLESVSNVRKFHHTVVAGLVEACNGFNEVFAPIGEFPSPRVHKEGSQSAFTPRSDTEALENATATATTTTTTTPEDDAKKTQHTQEELEARRKAYLQLKHTLDQIAPQYQDHFVNSIQGFFTQLNEHIQYCQELEDDYQLNTDLNIGIQGPLVKVSTNPFADDDGGNIYDEPTTASTTVSQAELHKKIISAG